MLPTRKILLPGLVVLLLVSCIKPYDPEIRGSDAKKYVVMGRVNNLDSLQTISITMTSSISRPEFLPLQGCLVLISDLSGNAWQAEDMGNGDYSVQIDAKWVIPGSAFMLEITTPAGEKLISAYDTVAACPPVDSVYYLREDIEGNIPGDLTLGIQFYVDLDGRETSSRYYLWECYETWEYRSRYPLEWYYDGEIHHVVPPDYSKMVCWSTQRIPDIYTLSTRILTENSYRMLPLHYVNNRSSRLEYGYSLRVRQVALSENAWIYWDQMQTNGDQEGGLYQQQPLPVRGNLINLSDPESEVLGFFGASTVTEKRIFVRDVPDLPLEIPNFCSPSILRFGLAEIKPRDYPAYLFGDAFTWYPILLNPACVDCLALGGINQKPVFWPE